MKITDVVYMLEIPAKSLMTNMNTTIYPTLILAGDARVLVDTGFPGLLDEVRHEMAQCACTPEELTHILLTHQDIDHLGNAAAIRKSNPAVQIWAHTLDAPYIQGDQTPLKLAQFEENLFEQPQEVQAIFQSMKRGFENSYSHVDRTLADGEILPFAGGMRVIHTPGHTPGHIALYLQQSRILIAGDTLRVREGALAPGQPEMNFDQVLSRQSLKKFLPLEIEQVVCYHGGLYRGPVHQALEEILAKP
jgi:glyoxylase-like metal-dependent hydrolase (beta-lactamase superfamily II)